MTKSCFIGLDVGRYEIFACVLSENREEITSFSFSQTHVGYNQLIDQVMHLQSQGLFPIVSAEGHDGNISPLDEYLITSQIPFKPLHPTAVSRYKEVLGQPQKTDAYDAFVIADLLWLQHQRIDEKQHHQEAGEFKSLSRTFKNLTRSKTQFTNQLQSELMSYFPELLTDKLFSKITGKAALNLLCEYPLPMQIQQLCVDKLAEFLSIHSKNHLGLETAIALKQRAMAVDRQPTGLESKALIVKTLAAQILAIDDHLGQIKKRIEKIGKASEVIMRMVSVPGISFLLATRLIGELQTFSRFATDSKLAMFVGLAPIAKDSGKVVGKHKTTHRANKIANSAMMQIAVCNSRNCAQSKIYYQKQRKAGKSHWQAIKCLARQLVRVLFAMSRDQTDYQLKALSMRVATT